MSESIHPDDEVPRFTLREFAGGLGDLGTFLPMSLAVCITCGMDFGVVLIGAGLMNVLSGWWLRQPIPVQPMKALAAVAIAQHLPPGALVAAGMWMGLIMFALGSGRGWAQRLAQCVPREIVCGIQIGVGLKLAWCGVLWLAALPPWGADSLLIAAAAGAALWTWGARHAWVLPALFAGGFLLLAFTHAEQVGSLSLRAPDFGAALPSAQDWRSGLFHGAVMQLPLTLLNSVLAVCALSAMHYPGRGIAPDTMARSVGLMNLLCVPLGAMPMCHGSGGLAAQYHFGARTGGSVIMLGMLKISAGLLLGATLIGALSAYPRSILAVTLILAGAALARLPMRHTQTSPAAFTMAVTAVGVVAINTLTGTLIGLACWLALRAAHRLRLFGSVTS